MAPQAQVGAQLYTLRDFQKTLPDIEATLKKVKSIGYDAVQISGFGKVEPEDVAKLCQDIGLNICATHMAWETFVNSTDEVIRIHHLWDCKHSAIGGLWGDYQSLEGLDRFAREFEVVGPKLKEAGLTFSYHNHNHELAKFDGQTWLDRLFEKIPADLLKAEIDVYWITAGGGDPAAWLRKYGKRQPLVHLKDMAVLPDRTQQFAEVGEGNLNWPEVLKACGEIEAEYLLVEQDNCYGKDPFECLATSRRNLKSWGY